MNDSMRSAHARYLLELVSCLQARGQCKIRWPPEVCIVIWAASLALWISVRHEQDEVLRAWDHDDFPRSTSVVGR
jgi:hypothetical protein